MVEGDLELREVVDTHFVDHHSDYCSENRDDPKACKDLGSTKSDGGARFIARVVGSGNRPVPFKVVHKELELGWKYLRAELSPSASTGLVKAADPLADSIAISALWFYGTGRETEGKQLLSVFPTSGDARDVLRRCIESAFSLPQATLT